MKYDRSINKRTTRQNHKLSNELDNTETTMERTKIKGWNRAKKFLYKYIGNRIIIKKVHNYYTIYVYPNVIDAPCGTLTYFESWKKMFWKSEPTGKLKQNIDNMYRHIRENEY